MQDVEPDFARAEREPVVATHEGGVDLGQKGGLRDGGRQVPQHDLGPIQHATQKP